MIYTVDTSAGVYAANTVLHTYGATASQGGPMGTVITTTDARFAHEICQALRSRGYGAEVNYGQ